MMKFNITSKDIQDKGYSFSKQNWSTSEKKQIEKLKEMFGYQTKPKTEVDYLDCFKNNFKDGA